MAFRKQKLASQLRDLAADFLKETAGPGTLLTVTDVRLDDQLERATVAFTVFPPKQEQAVLHRAERLERTFRAYAEEHTRTRHIPSITFAIDAGEKNRQRIDELLHNDEAH